MPEQIVLRPYQLESIDGLRDGRRAGHRSQILMSPTGSGKSVIAAHLLREAARKYSKAAFIVDRVNLVDQTSALLDKYGIDHGVVQAGHWRWRPYERIQICSAQTIEKRGFFPDLNLLIVDEAHTTRKLTADLIKNRTDLTVIGLTATPFAKGMAEIYSNLVNVCTTNQLVADGFLVPLKMYAAKAIDMTGAKVVAGEWADREIEKRGIEIVGDIVSEWVDKTNLHFGGPVKTIVFSATVDHGEELCRQFNAAGYNFQQVSYRDGSDETRRALIEEFRKADSSIDGLISCEVFTKGFDVPDIRCLAEGSRVLTDRGLVPIEQISMSDRIWDGHEFVTHGGAVFNGEKDVIEYAGLFATPDHLVKTAQGWRTFGECAREQIPIVQTGLDGKAIRESDCCFAGGRMARPALANQKGSPVRMPGLWDKVRSGARLVAQLASACVLRVPQGCANTAMADRASEVDAKPMRQSKASWLQRLWRARNPISLRECASRGEMDHGKHRRAGSGHQSPVGPHRKQWPLRAGQSSLVIEATEPVSHARTPTESAIPQNTSGVSANPIRGQNASQSPVDGADHRGDRRALSPAFGQTKRRVWDVLQAGPRNSFTCEGLLVHNCGIAARPYRKSLSSHIQQLGRVMRTSPGKEFGLWLDHCGNVTRFKEDTDDIFECGTKTLEDGAAHNSHARKDPEPKEKADWSCTCGFIFPQRMDRCPACGKEHVRQSMVQSVAGVMEEIGGGKAKKAKPAAHLEDKSAVWRQLCGYAMERKKGDQVTAQKFALAQFKTIYGHFPQSHFQTEGTPPISRELKGTVQNNIIRHFYKGKGKGAARADVR